MPLAKLDWSWHVEAEYSSFYVTITSTSHTPDSYFANTTEFPQWSQKVSTGWAPL